jgi:hypothetical protein
MGIRRKCNGNAHTFFFLGSYGNNETLGFRITYPTNELLAGWLLSTEPEERVKPYCLRRYFWEYDGTGFIEAGAIRLSKNFANLGSTSQKVYIDPAFVDQMHAWYGSRPLESGDTLEMVIEFYRIGTDEKGRVPRFQPSTGVEDSLGIVRYLVHQRIPS